LASDIPGENRAPLPHAGFHRAPLDEVVVAHRELAIRRHVLEPDTPRVGPLLAVVEYRLRGSLSGRRTPGKEKSSSHALYGVS
jgi:hypothetical protein